MIAPERGERIWRTLPKLEPRSEWEAQVHEIHSHVEGILRRVSKLEQGGGHASNQLVQLNRKCRMELATERQLAATATRIDVDIAGHRQDLQQTVEALKAGLVSQIAEAKAALVEEVELLKSSLRSTKKELHTLQERCQASEDRAEATFATKLQLEQACHTLRRDREESTAAVLAALAEMVEEKATRQELREATSSLAFAHDAALEKQRIEAADRVEQTNRAVVDLEHKTRAELGKSAEELQNCIADMRLRFEDGTQKQNELRADLSQLQAAQELAAVAPEELSAELRAWGIKHNDLDRSLLALQESVTARCEKTEQKLKELDRRERSSWEQFLLDRK